MTIIYNQIKDNQRQAIVLRSTNNKKLSSRNKRKWRYFVSGAGEYLGHIKLTFLFLAPVLAIGGFWLLIFGQTISADYKIYNLKQELSQIEEEINNLNEEVAAATSIEKVEKWAEENNFVKVKNFSYFDLSNKNLAQR
ncbi:MAG: hypothetical protein PHF45_02230 [Candidatus Pacebacteria bacterium]|nr:hypothetical protein [Candidatus Paceibacterota bacterium]